MTALAERRKAQPRILLFFLTATALTLTACGGDDDGPAPPPTSSTGGSSPTTPFPPTGGGDQPDPVDSDPGQPSDPQQPNAHESDTLAIVGEPPTSVRTDTTYDFLPEAFGPDTDSLAYSIENKPEWASFDDVTGRLTGKPEHDHLGTYPDIVISVSDGEETAKLEGFSIDVVQTASGSVALSWEPPSERADGTALVDLSGYKIYWGTVEGEYVNSAAIDNPSVTSYVVEELTPANYYLVATAVDSTGLESQFSNVVETSID